jgi:hypothetical protein
MFPVYNAFSTLSNFNMKRIPVQGKVNKMDRKARISVSSTQQEGNGKGATK